MRVGGVNNTNKIMNTYNKNKNIENKELKGKDKIKDSVEISSLGKSLITYSSNENVINSSEKVDKIKEEILKGTYNRDSKLVSQGILDEINRR